MRLLLWFCITPEVEVGTQGRHPASCGPICMRAVLPSTGQDRHAWHIGIVEVRVRGLGGLKVQVRIWIRTILGIKRLWRRLYLHKERKGWDMEGSLCDVSGCGRASVIPVDMIDMVSKEATVSLGGERGREECKCFDRLQILKNYWLKIFYPVYVFFFIWVKVYQIFIL